MTTIRCPSRKRVFTEREARDELARIIVRAMTGDRPYACPGEGRTFRVRPGDRRWYRCRNCGRYVKVTVNDGRATIPEHKNEVHAYECKKCGGWHLSARHHISETILTTVEGREAG